MTPDDIITKKDLEIFKEELFALLGKSPTNEQFGWLKNVEVRRLLGSKQRLTSAPAQKCLKFIGTVPATPKGKLMAHISN